MRYESFYPFANQQRYAQSQTQAPSPPYQSAFHQGQPYMQQPSSVHPVQGGQNGQQGYNPFSMEHLMGGPGQHAQAPQQQRGPSKPEMYMETANRLITTVQQYAPIVQQFAPMIQNLPAMWKLYRGFQSLPAAGAAGTAAAARTAAAGTAAAAVPRPSIPKVFQPPA